MTRNTALSIRITVETPIIIHVKNGNSVPLSCLMKPSPITLGRVPIGVARPPMDAAKHVIAVVAVFDVHAEMDAVTAPKAKELIRLRQLSARRFVLVG